MLNPTYALILAGGSGALCSTKRFSKNPLCDLTASSGLPRPERSIIRRISWWWPVPICAGSIRGEDFDRVFSELTVSDDRAAEPKRRNGC
jgi:hypothetical protein